MARGSVLIEEVLLIGLSIAVLVAVATLVSGILGSAVSGISNLQEAVNNAISGFLNDVRSVISGAFNAG